MEINIRLDKNFTTQYNKLQGEYGTYIARLNGFDDAQLSYTDFIDNFIDETTVADSSIDGNSNVRRKDIVTLLTEMPKPHRKLLAYNKIHYEYQKKYGFKAANDWLWREWIGQLYMHDGDTSTFKHYCFRGDTTFLTDEGIKTLKEMVGKDFKVLNKNHGWESATVKSFGKDILYKLTLERYGNEKEIYTTGNHIWFVKGDKGRVEINTENLEPGMKIPFNTSKVWSQVNPSPFGVAHGFFTGDGYKSYERPRANFCGDKIALLPYFTPSNVTGTESEYTTLGMPMSFNELPSLYETPSYLYGWLSGYFAADGCVDTEGRCTISSSKKENLEFVRNVLCVLGMPVNQIRIQNRISNLTNEMSNIYTLTLSSEYLKEDFFILPIHKQRFFKYTNKKDKKNRNWIVKSVKNTGVIDDVYCAVAYDTQSFTLDNNVLTHNCFAYDLKDVAEKGLFFLIDNFNPKSPKHLVTFVDFVKEYINFASNRSSGACGLPNLIPYMFYFWHKDIENDYMGVRTSHSEKKYAEQAFQRFIYAVNQPCVRDGQQSAFTNTSVFDRPYFEALFGGSTFPDGTYMIDFEDEIIDFQKLYMEVMSDIRSENMFTFPVSTISLLRKNGQFEDEDFAKWAIKHNMKWSDSNLFIDDNVSSLSNCCRLKSDIRDLGYFNSVGGTALKVGSVKVSTINLARLALDTNTKEEYLEELKVRTLSNIRALDIVRNIIKRNVEKGLLPNFSYQLVDFEHLYNTIGFIGIYETMKKFGCTTTDEFGNVYYTDKASTFGKQIFDTMREVADKFIADNHCDYMINTEQIPGESAASKLMNKDKFFYPEANIYDLPLYGNQFIPLGIKTTLKERIRIQAMFDRFCNGGSILHANIDSPFDSFDKAYKMTCYIADAGVTYFAFNTKIQACEDNHAFYGTTCPVCGKPIATEYTRVVGFYTPINTWTNARKKEYCMRKWENTSNGMGE